MKMTPEKMETAQEMRNDGSTYKEIGAVIGMSGGSVRYNLDADARAEITKRNAACRDEKAAYDAKYNAANKDKRAAYIEKHKERIGVRDKAYRAAHREEIAIRNVAYKETHEEELDLYHAAYRAEHREENVAYQQTYRELNKEAIQAYIKANSEKYAERSAARRALEAGWLIGATVAQKAEIKAIYKRAKEDPKIRCYLCGDVIALGDRHVDHIFPLSKGGEHRPSNLAIACSDCNLKKNSKLPEEIGLLL